jgi:dihydroorotate dehydrogenase (subfamily 1) family protein
VKKGGADAIVAINTVRAMKIDINAGMPVLSCKIGGLSGKAIKPVGIRCVYEIANEIELPVVGVGGIMSGEDAIEYMIAGAKVVQIGSAIYCRELDVFKKINNEIESFLDERNLELRDMVGMALKR